LIERHCRPYRHGDPIVSAAELAELLPQVPDWHLTNEGRTLEREFTGFASYASGLAFVNAVAALAEAEGHHPELQLGYKRVHVSWTTDAVDGLTENDFIAAAKTDRLAH
jgi:4a-hydroxytetrahydrobiopterin dehydratase